MVIIRIRVFYNRYHPQQPYGYEFFSFCLIVIIYLIIDIVKSMRIYVYMN